MPKKNEIVIFSSGAYSDYHIDGLYVALQNFSYKKLFEDAYTWYHNLSLEERKKYAITNWSDTSYLLIRYALDHELIGHIKWYEFSSGKEFPYMHEIEEGETIFVTDKIYQQTKTYTMPLDDFIVDYVINKKAGDISGEDLS